MNSRETYKAAIADIFETIENKELQIEAILEMMEDIFYDGYTEARLETENRNPWDVC